MKTRFLFLLLPLFLALTACEDSNADGNQLSDENEIELLLSAEAEEGTDVSVDQLPDNVKSDLEKDHFETFVLSVRHIPGRGYIIRLANGRVLFARENGQLLVFLRPWAGNGDHPHGPCFRRLRRFGTPVAVDDLSMAITDYVAANYPGENIRRAKAQGDTTLVLITGPTVLGFGTDDVFLAEWSPFQHCHRDRPICTDVAPDVVTIVENYVITNYPDAQIRAICGRGDNIFVLGRLGDARLILIFDAMGNFIEEAG